MKVTIFRPAVDLARLCKTVMENIGKLVPRANRAVEAIAVCGNLPGEITALQKRLFVTTNGEPGSRVAHGSSQV
jgi:hypothetical protein